MDPEAAQLVLSGILVIGAVVWLTGLQFLVRASRAVTPERDQDMYPDSQSPSAPNRLTGYAEVQGQPGVLATRAASILAKGSPLGPIKIVEKTDDRLAFERLGPGMANQPASRWFRRGELRFSTARQSRCRVEWTAELANMDWLLKLGALFQVLGLLALGIGGWAIDTYVVSSPEPAVRWQTVQIMQAVHFLWPPFLFGALYRRGRKEVAAHFEALAHNLPYYES